MRATIMGYRKSAELVVGASVLAAVSASLIVGIQKTWEDAPYVASLYAVQSGVFGLMCIMCLDMARLNPANSHTFFSLLTQYLLFHVVYYVSWIFYVMYHRKLKDCRAMQEETLRWIVRENGKTAYGIDHGISSIKSREDFVEKHPITTYSQYEAYAERAAKGEKNVMTKADILMLGLSSGTTGKKKKYPFTASLRPRFLLTMLPAMYTLNGYYQAFGLQRVFQFRLFHPPVLNAYGLIEGGIGSILAKPAPFNITPKAFLKGHTEPVSFYIQAVFALAEKEVGLLDGFSSDLWYSFFKFISANKDKICSSIHKGVFSAFPGLSEELMWELNKSLRADPERAAELRHIFMHYPVEGLARRIWPNVIEIICAKSGGMAHCAKLLAESYTAGVRMSYFIHMATEGLIGNSYEETPDKCIYTFAPMVTFFEFIREDDITEENPKTLFLDQLEVGQNYEVIVTNSLGLYRNRFGDVIRVTGYVGNTPKYKFVYRSGQILNIAFDRTPEQVFYEALVKTTSDWTDVEVVNYTATESLHLDKITGNLVTPANYVTFMEAVDRDANNANISQEQVLKFDEDLCSLHETYQEFRHLQSVGPLSIVQVEKGTFGELRSLLSGGKLNHQFKMPHVIRKQELLQFLWNKRL